MPRPDPVPLTIEYQLLVARRRMAALAPGSPSWDAAIEGVEELERAVSRTTGGGPDVESPLHGVTVNPGSRPGAVFALGPAPIGAEQGREARPTPLAPANP